MIKSCFFALLLMVALSTVSRSASAQVKVWLGTLTLPTYEVGLPDPNPPFDIYAGPRFNYPYTLRNNLTGAKADQPLRAVFLENEYLKCSVLPDIGGHIYTCIDKISGQPIFYANPSIKKAKIGYRGAWAAFGVEFNFPVSHNWVSMSPVDFAWAAHEDGSASVWVSNIDRPNGMQWQIELVLRPGSTLLEQHTTLYNRSDLRHRYYWWSNAGVEVWDDSRIDYPMRFAASHGYTDIYHWPVDAEGRDLSVIRNQTSGPVSMFVHGSREPYMGIWHPHTQTGIAHYAEFAELPGKKVWSWGVDPDGLGWRTALSDNQSAYVEVQAGLFRNQETYAFLDPGETIHFTEYWMPVRGTGGITRANKAGVVYFHADGASLSVALNVNQRVPGARVSLTQDGNVLWSETADLAPEKTWSHAVTPAPNAGKTAFELVDSACHSLLKQTDGEFDWDPEVSIQVGPQPVYRVPEPQHRSEDQWLEWGQDQELNGKSLQARATYRQALEAFPESQSLTIAAGRLAASLQQYEEAEPLLRRAQMHDTPNSETAYYLGIAEEGLGDQRAAETSFEIAYRQSARRAPAAIRLGELRARQGDLEAATAFFRAAVSAQPANLRAQEELEAVLRAGGETAEADALARQALAAAPTSDFLKNDQGSPDLDHLAADPYRVLRVADQYIRLGLFSRALELLERKYPAVAAAQSEPGSVPPQQHPLVLYYAAYCHRRLGDSSPQFWGAASKLPTAYVFPTSETDRIVLEAALAVNASDATAHLLLGDLLISKGSIDPAMAHWDESRRLAPHQPLIDVQMGNALLKLKNNPQGALASFREGLRNDPENEQVYAGLDSAMSLTGASAADRAAALSEYPSANTPQSTMPSNLVYQLALTRAEAAQFAPALALFKDRFFPSEEGGVTTAQVLHEIKLMQAEAWAAAGDCAHALGFLRESEADAAHQSLSAREQFKLASIAQFCGQSSASQELLRKAAASDAPSNLVWAIRAQRLVGAADPAKARQQLETALANAERQAELNASSGSWWYEIGSLQQALGITEQARKSFEMALTLTDTHMSHHLARLALAEIAASR